MAAGEEAIAILKSIDSTLKQLLALSQRRTPKVKDVASDRDLDSKYGDPKVTFNPRDWSGDDMKRRRMSGCPADFLELLADALDYFADQAEATNQQYNGKPTAPYKRKDAARARGWAKRIKDGKHQPAGHNVESSDWGDGDDGWGEEAEA